MSIVNFFYRPMRKSDPRSAPRFVQERDDPFEHPLIAGMDLRLLADLPPEQLRDSEPSRSSESLRLAQHFAPRGRLGVL